MGTAHISKEAFQKELQKIALTWNDPRVLGGLAGAGVGALGGALTAHQNSRGESHALSRGLVGGVVGGALGAGAGHLYDAQGRTLLSNLVKSERSPLQPPATAPHLPTKSVNPTSLVAEQAPHVLTGSLDAAPARGPSVGPPVPATILPKNPALAPPTTRPEGTEILKSMPRAQSKPSVLPIPLKEHRKTTPGMLDETGTLAQPGGMLGEFGATKTQMSSPPQMTNGTPMQQPGPSTQVIGGSLADAVSDSPSLSNQDSKTIALKYVQKARDLQASGMYGKPYQDAMANLMREREAEYKGLPITDGSKLSCVRYLASLDELQKIAAEFNQGFQPSYLDEVNFSNMSENRKDAPDSFGGRGKQPEVVLGGRDTHRSLLVKATAPKVEPPKVRTNYDF